jgi:hypothetical protein
MMKEWIKQFKFAAPHTMKFLTDQQQRFRVMRNLYKREPNADSIFIWKYRVHNVSAPNFDLTQIVITLVDGEGQHHKVTLHDLIAQQTEQVKEWHTFLHSDDRFLLSMIWAEIAGKQMKTERAIAKIKEGSVQIRPTASYADYVNRKLLEE